MPELVIVIINYNTWDLLGDCLKGILRTPPPCHFEVQVVNNGPPDELLNVGMDKYPGVRFHQAPRNLGFAGAANLGASLLKSPYLLVMNPDVIPEPNSWARLRETLLAHPAAGLVVPKLVNPDGSLQDSARRFYSMKTLLLRRSPFNRLFPRHPAIQHHLMKEWDHQGIAEIDWALGAAMLVRKEALQGKKIFDERFFLYFEDVDLCYRLRDSGWKVLYDSAAVMVHKHRRESARNWLHPVKFYHLSSLMKFLLKHHFRLSPAGRV
jgi:N-acetylglucosaminyl-diphospho-decaprenol L-rhamnosyltransferase